jgi:hypothetical protein
MIQVSMVPKELIHTCWESVGPFLDRAARYTYGRYTVDDIHAAIVDYDHDLWVAFEGGEIKGAVVTNFMNYPKRKVLSMTFCGGVELSKWKDPMLDLLRRYAKDMGCDGIEATARRGWAKIFQNDGHKSLWATFELPLEGVNHG